MTAPPLTPAAWLRYDAIRRGFREAAPGRVLEVGAGEGAFACRLAARFDYEGIEPDPESFAVAARRLAALGRGRVRPITTAELVDDEPFDLVCAFEVLEHLRDPHAELRRWGRLLRPGGHALVSVPAHRDRFGPADHAVGHHRRFDRTDLQELFQETGFAVMWIEAWGAGLGHALETIRHRVARREARGRRPPRTSACEATGRSGRWLQPRGRTVGTLAAIASAPFRVLQYPLRRSEMGIGWVALAQCQGRSRTDLAGKP